MSGLLVILETATLVYPAVFKRESMGRALRMIKSRFIDLHTWANVTYVVGEILARALTLGTRGLLDLGDLLLFCCAPRLLKNSPFYDVIESTLAGGRRWRRTVRRYRGVPEFRRLVLISSRRLPPCGERKCSQHRLGMGSVQYR